MKRTHLVQISVSAALVAGAAASWVAADAFSQDRSADLQFGRGHVERLSICVDGASEPSSDEFETLRQGAAGLRWWHDEAQLAIAEAVAEQHAEEHSGSSQENDHEHPTHYEPVAFVEPEVVLGCPGGPVLAPPTDLDPGAAVRMEPADEVSRHQVHVYLLDQEAASEAAGMRDEGFRRMAYERVCDFGHEGGGHGGCAEATVALFVDRSAVADDPSFAAELLAHATGLHRAVHPHHGRPSSEYPQPSGR